jgi:predicted cupin superfamily sugar epimerase
MSKAHDSEFIGRRNFLKRATFVGAAVVTPELAASAQRPSRNPVTQIPDELTADEVRNLLKLEPHATCGFVRVTFMSKERIAPGGLPAPFADGRPAGSALYFMVTPGAPVRLHRIRNDQLYHYYLGDPLEVLMLRVDGTTQHVVVGPDLRRGQLTQLLIPGNTFHTARVIGRRRWFLGASTEWPGVEPVDVEIGNVDALAAKYPQVADDLRTFPVPVKK